MAQNAQKERLRVVVVVVVVVVVRGSLEHGVDDLRNRGGLEVLEERDDARALERVGGRHRARRCVARTRSMLVLELRSNHSPIEPAGSTGQADPHLFLPN